MSLRLGLLNRNFKGTHFGGSLFAMTDPMYVLMLSHILGPDYILWDKAGSIDYVTPGRGWVTARFQLDDSVLQRIRDATASGEKYLPVFHVEIVGADGELVARVSRTVYVRRKPARAQ